MAIFSKLLPAKRDHDNGWSGHNNNSGHGDRHDGDRGSGHGHDDHGSGHGHY